MANKCEKVGKGLVEFCYECDGFPCARLKALDKRYRTKYENLYYIQQHGMEDFLKNEQDKWNCSNCGENICCHNGLCMNCELDVLINNKKYHWDEN